MNQSIITEYHEQSQYSPAKRAYGHLSSSNTQGYRKLSPIKSKQEIYGLKLQQKIKQLKAQIQKNKPLIQQAKAQRKFFKRISDKQKSKIEQTNVQLMRDQYEKQISQLRIERERLQDMISLVHEEWNLKINDCLEARSEVQENRIFLLKSLEEVRNQNVAYENLGMTKNQTVDELEKRLSQLQQQIRLKESVQKKYIEIRNMINKIEESRTIRNNYNNRSI